MNPSEQELLRKVAYYESLYERLREDYRVLMNDMSRIDYLCGEPNEMECSDYDIHCDSGVVVDRVSNIIHERNALREKFASVRRIWETFFET